MKTRIISFIAAMMASVMVLSAVTPASEAVALSGLKSYFNNPLGNTRQQQVIRAAILKDINAARKGDTIRVATYTLADKGIVNALINASRDEKNGRFVPRATVQVILDEHAENTGVDQLKKALGEKVTDTGSWLKICNGSCLTGGGKGVMHTKLYMFSRGKIVHMGSANLSTNAFKMQWNQMVRFHDDGMYAELNDIFDDMKLDRETKDRDQFTSGNYTLTTYPQADITKSTDPLMKDLNKIHCKNAAGTAGTADHRTKVLVSQYSMNGNRGEYLARELVSLKNDGCQVRVALGGESSSQVRKILINGGILQDSQGQSDGGSNPKQPYNHEKWMAVSGRFGTNDEAFVVWTGSMNWSSNEYRRDNLYLRIKGDKAMFTPYEARMDQLKSR